MATSTSGTGGTVKKAAKLGVFTLMIMNIVAVVSLRGLPAEAEYGMSSAFYYLFAALVFLIPVSLVAAELAAMFPGHFPSMGREHDMVSNRADFRCGESRFCGYGSCV